MALLYDEKLKFGSNNYSITAHANEKQIRSTNIKDIVQIINIYDNKGEKTKRRGKF